MSINAISPIDGRYHNKTKKLSEFYSEKALIKYRIYTEIKYLIMLSKSNVIRELSIDELQYLQKIIDIKDEDAQIVKDIENKGYKDIPATNHDVKAIEYFIKFKLKNTSLENITEMVHFCLTSEDINNIAYSLMLKEGVNRAVIYELINVYDAICNFAFSHKDTAMLARTHGQPASPTTFGKEMIVFASRIKEEIKTLSGIPLLVKLNGATGNYNAHNAVFHDIDWQKFSEKLVETINNDDDSKPAKYTSKPLLTLKHNKITTQIESHDSMARVFDGYKRINTILIDFCQDIWRYISDGWIKQKPIKGEIGSSAMPHKVNPIDFENAEGNLGVANALLSFLSNKLLISRLQRDLSDSTVLRNIGTAMAHSFIAYQSILKGLSKIEIDKSSMTEALNNAPEVIAEAYQNILRNAGVEKPYELLKELTRGKKINLNDFYKMAEKLEIKNELKEKLLRITPENYTGIAAKIVEGFDPVIY
jgi:adenylosuccinate lyase